MAYKKGHFDVVKLMLNKRIKFCMDLRNDAVKALIYPAKEDKKDFKEESDDDDDDGDLLSRLLEDMGMDFWDRGIHVSNIANHSCNIINLF